MGLWGRGASRRQASVVEGCAVRLADAVTVAVDGDGKDGAKSSGVGHPFRGDDVGDDLLAAEG